MREYCKPKNPDENDGDPDEGLQKHFLHLLLDPFPSKLFMNAFLRALFYRFAYKIRSFAGFSDSCFPFARRFAVLMKTCEMGGAMGGRLRKHPVSREIIADELLFTLVLSSLAIRRARGNI